MRSNKTTCQTHVIKVCLYLLIDFNSFLVLLQLSAVVSDLQETFVGRAETQTETHTGERRTSEDDSQVLTDPV